MEAVIRKLAEYGVIVTRVIEDEDEIDEKEIVEKVDDECWKGGDMTTEETISELIKIINPDVSINKYQNNREDFSVIMPNGEDKKVPLWPSATLSDLNKDIDDHFGRNCFLFGIKQNGKTIPPPTNLMVGMYNKRDHKEQLSIVYCINQ